MDRGTWEEGSRALAPFLSERGKAARMPEGIRVWGERAARAGALDATLGVIKVPASLLGDSGEGDRLASLPDIRDAFRDWDPLGVFPYAPVAGVRQFRAGWRRWIALKAAGGDPDAPAPLEERLPLPVVTPGVTGALATTAHLILDPGEAVLVPERRWDGYDTTFATVAGARLVPVRLLEAGAWDVDCWREAMIAVAARQPRVVAVVNFPHNPTGYVPADAEARAFEAAAIDVTERTGRSVIVLCDDAYEGFVYTDRPRWSLFYRLIDRHPRLLPVKCDGITKELLFWGGRVGAVTAALPPAGESAAAEAVWEDKLSAVVRGLVSAVSTPVQTLVGRLLEDPRRLLAARAPLLASLVERREAMAAALAAPAAREAFDADPFHGGLFALLNLRRGEAVALAHALLDERRIGTVPFRDPDLGLNALRVTYATVPRERVADLVEAAAELACR